MQNGEPCIIVNNDFVNPGKGQAFSRVRFRTLISGKTLEKTFKSGDFVKLAVVMEVNSLYLYNDNELWYFMDCKNFDQIIVDTHIVGNNFKWLSGQINCIITLWNGHPITVIPPHFVDLKVIDADSGIKGNTAANNTGSKLVKLITGVIIKVPLFIKVGEIVKVNTKSGEYVSRIK